MLIHNNYIHTGNTPREHMYTILNRIEKLTNKGIEMTEEQPDEPDSPSTQPDLTTIQRHDDSPYIVNEVLSFFVTEFHWLPVQNRRMMTD